MNRRVRIAVRQGFFVILTLPAVLLAACGGGGSDVATATADSPSLIARTAPSNLQATAASSSAIGLTWTEAFDNEEGFKVYRGTGSSSVTTPVATLGAGITNYTDSGLAAATTYYYTVTAYNSAGESSASDVANATTDPAPVVIPGAPSNLQATAASSSAIGLTWTDASDDEEGFKVYRGTDSSIVTTLVATLGAGITNYTDTGLAAATTYYYTVTAYNSAGESSASNVANATTNPAPVVIPGAPSSLQATAASSSAIGLIWTDASDNEEGFKVYRGTGSSTVTTLVATLGAGITNYTDTGLAAATTFYYAVTAYNSAGASSASNVANATTNPAPVPTSVDGGNLHSLALMNNGTVLAWGGNDVGQLGDGTIANRYAPVQVVGLTGGTAISAGAAHSLVLLSDGTVRAWGGNLFGELGDGTTINRSTPVALNGLGNVRAISAGGYFSVALKNDGTVWAWGSGAYGQIGDGTLNNRQTPVRVSGLGNITAISANQNHSLALKNDGTVWAWGRNDVGQLGDGTVIDRSAPVKVVGLTGVTAVSAGEAHSFALLSDGTVRAWGGNFFGELGDGTTTHRSTPVAVTGLSDVRSISAGGYFSVALKNDGTVWTWGSGADGQIGDGTLNNRQTPAAVSGLGNVTAISNAEDHTLVIRDGMTVWAWGYNAFGQLGDNTAITRLTPVPTSGF